MSSKKLPKDGASAKSGPEIRLSPLDRSPGRMIYRAHVAMRSGLLRILHKSGFDLSIEEWVILSSLWEYGEMTQPELGHRVGKDRHFVSRLLDSLASRHLVQRKGTKNDRRINRVSLTAKGEGTKTVLLAELAQFYDQVFSGVSHAQYETFMQCLDTVATWPTGRQANEADDPPPAAPLGDPSDGFPGRRRTADRLPRAVRRKRT